MQVNRKFFPQLMQDNEQAYFNHLIGIIESVDELSTLEILKKPHAYQFRLAPSHPRYSESLLKEILRFHNMLKIKLNLSKSIKSSAAIVFEINLRE